MLGCSQAGTSLQQAEACSSWFVMPQQPWLRVSRSGLHCCVLCGMLGSGFCALQGAGFQQCTQMVLLLLRSGVHVVFGWGYSWAALLHSPSVWCTRLFAWCPVPPAGSRGCLLRAAWPVCVLVSLGGTWQQLAAPSPITGVGQCDGTPAGAHHVFARLCDACLSCIQT